VEREAEQQPMEVTRVDDQPKTATVTVEESSPSNGWFRWTEEREQRLMEAITTSVGSLEKINGAVIKKIATELSWPHKSVEYKIARWRKQNQEHAAEPEETPPDKEAD
jgi:hypothetical protein